MELIISVVALVFLSLLAILAFKFLFFSKYVEIKSKDELDEIDRIITTKYKEVNIHRNRAFTFIMGFFVTMIFAFILVEYKRMDEKKEAIAHKPQETVKDEGMIDVPLPPPPPPPPPPKPEIAPPVMVEVEIEVEKDTVETPEPEPNEDDFGFSDEDLGGDDLEPKKEEVKKVVDNTEYTIVDVSAQPFTGDVESFAYEYVMSEVIPANIQSAVDNGAAVGFLALHITIEKSGAVSHVQVIESIDPQIDAEIIRIIKSAPKWTPAKIGERVVRQKVAFEMIFE